MVVNEPGGTVPVGQVLKEPNLGTAVVTAIVGASVFMAAGVRWWKMALVTLPVPFPARFAFDHMRDYQRARITTFLNPESDPLGAGYNIIQSKIAPGSGGMWGNGLLQSTQGHLNFLPEKHTDCIFTTVAEEFGLVGSLAVLSVLACLMTDGVPLPLPLVSHGGSAMLTVMFGFGLLMSVHVPHDVEFADGREY